MYGPPIDPRYRSTVDRTTWRSLLAGYAMIPGFLLALWVVSHPAAGVVVLASLVCLGTAVRRASRLVRCFRDCGGFSFHVGRVRISVSRPRIDDAC